MVYTILLERSVYVLNNRNELINIRNNNISEDSYFKLESNLYKESILSFIRIIFLIIYPIFLILSSYIINKKAEK